MKRKYAIITLGIAVGISMMTGCSNGTTSDTADSTIYGEVSEVGTDSITIEVGTQKEMEEPESTDESAEAADSTESTETTDSTESAESTETIETTDSTDSTESTETTETTDSTESTEPAEGGEMPSGQGGGGDASMLELTGETMEITITDDTVISSQGGMGSGGGMGGEAPSGDMAEGETPPDAPDGTTDGSTDDTADASTSESTTDTTDSSTSESTTDTADASAEDSTSDSDAADGETPPDLPDGESAGDGEAPSDTEQTTETISLEDISEGDIVCITLDEDGNATEITVISGGMGAGGGMGGGQSSGVDSYTAVTEYSTDTEVDGESYSSTGTDENAIHVLEGAIVSLSNITVDRTSSDSTGGDNSSFYGVGAAILTTEGTSYISNATVTTDAAGGAGIFSYGDGITYVSDSTITTQQDTSGGIHVAGGGTLYAWDLTVETNGESAAAIRSDRGSGTMVVDGGTYTSNGVGSPAVYSTADITINDAELTATGSEAICIEGLNTIRLYDCDLTGNMSDDDQNDTTWNVTLYQSMSGDSEEGNSTFEMQGGTLTANNGGMFYTTNTESTITLSDVDITYASDSEFFLQCTGNNNARGWGDSGNNGADCLFTAISQEMEGSVIWDSISNLDFYITEGSTLTGAVINDETYAGDGGDGYCNVYIDSDSTWVVTGDSTLSELQCEGSIVDEDGNTVTIQGSDGTVYVEGTSDYTITVESYSDSADVSGASTLTSWSDYEVEKPDELG